MNKEMSETLTRVGPGTRMGKLLRRYWVPALMSSEIAEPATAPVPFAAHSQAASE